MPEFSIYKTNRGHEKLAPAGFTYTFRRMEGTIKTWRCVKITCYGAVKLENKVIFTEKAQNHYKYYTSAKDETNLNKKKRSLKKEKGRKKW
jgi:hypothetical protein